MCKTETTADQLATQFESETCSRCGGCGQYSYCQMYGTRCFRCNGRGRTLTKRGAAAMQFLNKSLEKRADEVRVGDTVLCRGLGAAWRKVTAVGFANGSARWLDKETGEWRPYFGICCDADGYSYGMNVMPDTPVTVAWPAEEKAAKRAAALAYQATLTKQGKPRKR